MGDDSRTRRTWLTGVGCALLGLLGGLFLPRLLLPPDGTPAEAVPLAADPACVPTGRACTARRDGLSLTLRLPDEIQPLEAFALQVVLAGPQAGAVETVLADFTMADMEMGRNRFQMERQPGGQWRGQALLPVCTSGRRDWRVTVEVVGERVYAGRFFLTTGPR